MDYSGAKVYCDGSHYIAIPHTERPKKQKRYRIEKTVLVGENNELLKEEKPTESVMITSKGRVLTEVETTDKGFVPVLKKVEVKGKRISRKELFERLYTETNGCTRKERRERILDGIKGCFKSVEDAQDYVDSNMERKLRNLICRRVRLCRKAYLNKMNYFCTFTYDDNLQTEESFEKKIKRVFANYSNRYGWKYMGVWERGRNTDRLHFHGLFYIPDGCLCGELIETKDYDKKTHSVTVKHQHPLFLKNFGRNDFKEIPDLTYIGEAISYIIKYLEKSGGKILYSRGLSQYFLADILEDDIVCKMSDKEYENNKVLLYDDFLCIDEGEVKGTVSPDVIKSMPKSK